MYIILTYSGEFIQVLLTIFVSISQLKLVHSGHKINTDLITHSYVC